MPLLALGVGTWLSLIETRSNEQESGRVRVFLTQLLEESALDSSAKLRALDASDPVIAAEFRLRLSRSAQASVELIPLVEVRVGDLGVGAVGNASHTALACYRGRTPIAVRVVATASDPVVRVVGVFEPDAADFSALSPGSVP